LCPTKNDTTADVPLNGPDYSVQIRIIALAINAKTAPNVLMMPILPTITRANVRANGVENFATNRAPPTCARTEELVLSLTINTVVFVLLAGLVPGAIMK
jgi:hypothetical protein